MKKPTPQEIQERFETLPEDIKRVITSDLVSDAIEALGARYKLRMDKTGDLIDEVGMVMLGFKKSSDFISNLSIRLKIDRETAESLAVDIDNQVFKKIRESLREVQFAERDDTSIDSDGSSPVRDSMLKDLEREVATEIPVGMEDMIDSSDYSATGFDAIKQDETDTPVSRPVIAPPEPTPTPYEQSLHQEEITQEKEIDPNKTFKDHLEEKLEKVKPIVNADPYRESID